MHASEMEDIVAADPGDIVAMFGVDCNSGDTFTDGTVNVTMTSIHVPDAVISVAIKPKDSAAETKMSKALRRFTKEDPTFRVSTDSSSGQTIIFRNPDDIFLLCEVCVGFDFSFLYVCTYSGGAVYLCHPARCFG